MESEKTLSSEETYLIHRSNKKIKRKAMGNQREDGDEETTESMDTDYTIVSTEEEEDESCPTILLTKEEKKRLHMPWTNSLIIKLFDKRLSYAVLIRRLRLMWSLTGEIALTDVGCAYYVVRFTSMADYEFVLTQGPWMIGDSYLTIRKWIPNFFPDEEPIKTLTAWVRIPNLSVEYFDRNFLHHIGKKIGRVVRIDKNTESMDRGQYIRFCIEVDLSKPLLSKFRLNGRVWRIQYEGLRQICFKCGHLGHKDAECPKFRSAEEEEGTLLKKGNTGQVEGQSLEKRPEELNQYGTANLMVHVDLRAGPCTIHALVWDMDDGPTNPKKSQQQGKRSPE
ncbi:uncharacterized protein [Spinacia oleracea]|uniref:CCHC-type domain-containing protein n=1 Tax=Spinacia oleracea TaxID=3562 RepID=A0ABM3QYK7_SPIOL|nr:uncharacterized protein LOC130463365 [Spinacia oleracea]